MLDQKFLFEHEALNISASTDGTENKCLPLLKNTTVPIASRNTYEVIQWCGGIEERC